MCPHDCKLQHNFYFKIWKRRKTVVTVDCWCVCTRVGDECGTGGVHNTCSWWCFECTMSTMYPKFSPNSWTQRWSEYGLLLCCAVLPGWKMKCGEGKKLRTANGQRLHSVGVRKRNTKRKFQQYVPVEYSTSLRVFRTRNQGWGWTNVLGSKIWESHVLVV